MTGIGHDPQVGFGPGLLERPCRARRGADVVAALNDDPGYSSQRIHVPQELAFLEEEVLEEELGADACKRNRLGRIAEAFEQVFIGQQCRDMPFPQRPFAGRSWPTMICASGPAGC